MLFSLIRKSLARSMKLELRNPLMSACHSRMDLLVSFSAMRRMKIDGATPLECGMVILTVRAGNCAVADGAIARSAKPNRKRSIKRP